MSTVAIVAVGTEITSGEILNRNSQWLSQELTQLGFEVVLHLTIADERETIYKAFEQATAAAEILLITGGLGPTSDDFTREVVAQFVGQQLLFRDQVFADLTELYAKRGLTLREAHKQQCFFPEKARLLENPVGTALGFSVEHNQIKIFVLPGPPREVEGVYQKSLRPELEPLRPQRKELLVKWRTLAIPESEVAEKVEPLVQKYGLRVGYRASAPYVIVKVWLPSEKTNGVDGLTSKAKEYYEQIESSLGDWVVAKGDEDLAEMLIPLLNPFSDVRILDEATGGKLGARLSPFLKAHPGLRLEYIHRTFQASESEFLEPREANFTVRIEGASSFRVSAEVAGRALSQKLDLPYKIDPRSDRGQIQIAELALFHWLKIVKA